MRLRQRRLLAGTILALYVALGSAWLLRLDFSRKISTDALDLIPANERAPELAMVRAMASEAEARATMLVLTAADGTPAPVEAAREFARQLVGTGAFTQALALADPAWRDDIGRTLFELRFALLFPHWLEQQQRKEAVLAVPSDSDIPRRAAKELKAFLETPEALAYQDLVPADPLLLLPGALQRMNVGLGLGSSASVSPHTGLVWAQLAASPLSEAGQQPAFEAIDRAMAAVRREFSGLAVAYTGVNRFAAASRARIEREVSWLNTASLLVVLGVAWILIRRVHRALHLVPVIALATLGAWVATTLAFERVHIIVFALGALLAGVAIDYGFYLYMQPPLRPDESYGEKVRRLLKPLLASCFTTVVGFALLVFAELPMIRQLGVFVGAGLLCALGVALLYFALLEHAFLEARTFSPRVGLSRPWRRRLRVALVLGWCLAIGGLLRLTWRDDIRELEVPSPEVLREDARVRSQFGQGPARTVYVTHGRTLDEARSALQRFERWQGPRAQLANLGALLPAPEAREAARRFIRDHPRFPALLRSALQEEGFAVDEFAPFFEAYAAYTQRAGLPDTRAAMAALRARLTGPLALLLHEGPDRAWFVTVVEHARGDAPPAETQTVPSSQLQSLNRLFASYRASALHLSLAGLALVGIGVLLTYGVRDGLRIFAIPCGACLGIFGLMGWLGQPLNLFHLLGAFLGVCLTHNYSIFSATSAYRHEPPPVSVRLSALTTAASFGVLACSSIPVVRELGVTVAAMVVAALLLIELEHLTPLSSISARSGRGNSP